MKCIRKHSWRHCKKSIMINQLINGIKSAIAAEMTSGGTLSAFRSVEYANDLNNIVNSPAVRFYLTSVIFPAVTSPRGYIDITFSFCFYSSKSGGNIQQMQQFNNSLLWDDGNSGIIPFLKKLPSIKFDAFKKWQLARFTDPQFGSGNIGKGMQYMIITDLTFRTMV